MAYKAITEFISPPEAAVDAHNVEESIVKKKLIEVALPLDAINTASAQEKSTRRDRGHPSTLRLWWARGEAVG